MRSKRPSRNEMRSLRQVFFNVKRAHALLGPPRLLGRGEGYGHREQGLSWPGVALVAAWVAGIVPAIFWEVILPSTSNVASRSASAALSGELW